MMCISKIVRKENKQGHVNKVVNITRRCVMFSNMTIHDIEPGVVSSS